MSPTTGNVHRPEIQALRALAVTLVFGYHLRPDVVPVAPFDGPLTVAVGSAQHAIARSVAVLIGVG